MNENTNIVKGFFGSLLLGIIGFAIILFIFTQFYINIHFLFLYIIGLFVYKGYTLFKGAKNPLIMRATIGAHTLVLCFALLYILDSRHYYYIEDIEFIFYPVVVMLSILIANNKLINRYLFSSDIPSTTSSEYTTSTSYSSSQNSTTNQQNTINIEINAYIPNQKLLPNIFLKLILLIIPFGIILSLLFRYEDYISNDIVMSFIISIALFILTLFAMLPYLINAKNAYRAVVKHNHRTYFVDLNKLNNIPKYTFFFGFKMAYYLKKQAHEDKELLIMLQKAIYDFENNNIDHTNKNLPKAVIYLNNLQCLQNKKYFYSLSYTDDNGATKVTKLQKVYDNLNLFREYQFDEINKRVPINIFLYLIIYLIILSPIIPHISFFLDLETYIFSSDYQSSYLEEDDDDTPTIDKDSHSYEYLSYKVDSSHKHINDEIGAEDSPPLYSDFDDAVVYGIYEITSMQTGTPDDVFNSKLESVTKLEGVDVIDFSTSLYESKDLTGTYYYEGYISYTDNSGMYNHLKIISYPTKNLTVSLISINNRSEFNTDILDELQSTMYINHATINYLDGKKYVDVDGYVYDFKPTFDLELYDPTTDTTSSYLYNSLNGLQAMTFIDDHYPEVDIETIYEFIADTLSGYFISPDAYNNYDTTIPYHVSIDSFHILEIYSLDEPKLYVGFYIEELGIFEFVSLIDGTLLNLVRN